MRALIPNSALVTRRPGCSAKYRNIAKVRWPQQDDLLAAPQAALGRLQTEGAKRQEVLVYHKILLNLRLNAR
jgi:hypothetical protein